MGQLITKRENDIIMALTPETADSFGMLEDFVLRSNSGGINYMRLRLEDGFKVIKAGSHVGLVQLADGTKIELLPRVPGVKDDAMSRQIMYRMLSAMYDIPYDGRSMIADENDTFIEFFISVFVRECMKIIKSGMLSGYETVEENTSQMKGTILFAENNRRNLVHRERLYVRHDEFTPDRAENRLVKTTAAVMHKLTGSRKNAQELKKIIVYLDAVKLSVNFEDDFSKCINTRNAKKYSSVLNICRLFLKNKANAGYSGKYVTYAQLFSMNDLFRAYAAQRIKTENPGKTVRTGVTGNYLCAKQQCFPLQPDIVIYDDNSDAECLICTRWSTVQLIHDIDASDVNMMFACSELFGCRNIVMLFPSAASPPDLPDNGHYYISCGGGADLRIRFIDVT